MSVVEQGRGPVVRPAIMLTALLVMGGIAWAVETDGLSGEEPAAPEAPAKPVRISMDFKDADLKNVLKSFSQQAGLNVIASDDVATRTITMFLEDVTVMDALDRILEAGNLTYERPAGSQIYVVKPKPKAAPEPVPTITKVYRLKFARVSTSRLAKAAEELASSPTQVATLQGGSTGTSGTSGGSTSTSTSQTTGTTAGEEIGVDKVVGQLLTENGKVTVDERTNSLVVTDIPSNFLRIESVLKALDIRTAQVLIEVEVLETTLAKAKDLGVKWGSGTAGTVFQLTPAQHKTNFPFGDWFGRHGWRSISDADTGLTTSHLGTVDASQAVAILQALEKDTDTKILARPKILTLDNERAVIQLSTQEAVGFKSTVSGSSGTTTAEPERVTTGTILVVTPQVNEHGYITMMVEPSVTKTSTSIITPPSSAGSAVKDPKTRSARALVRMRQGETLVMGGLIDRTEEDIHSKVPVLGDVPILGAAFRHNDVSNSASELVVFVTPKILEEPSETQLASSPAVAPLGPREQEPANGRQEEMEKRLNALEREKHL